MTDKIKEFLDKVSKAYYEGNPIISDSAFDAIAESYGYNSIGSPVATGKAKHLRPMWSLQKHYEDEGVAPLKGISDIVVTPKLDGAALALVYVDGALVRATTRGDGVEGQDVTNKFLGSSLVPQEVGITRPFQVTGEVCAPNHVENARNYAAGSLNLKDVEEFRTRAVEFFAYGIEYLEGIEQSSTYTQDLELLASLGFSTVSEPELHKIYPCDGVVYRVNSNKLFVEMGYTANHPRGAYALKERQEAVETKILAVEWQVGKSGKVTPVAILEPIMIGDAEISRATLNNVAFIESLGIEIGDTVAVQRAGMIIPQILYKVEA